VIYRIGRTDKSIRPIESGDYEFFRVENHDISSDYTFLIHIESNNADEVSDIVFIAERWEYYSNLIGIVIGSPSREISLPASFDVIYEHKSNISSPILKKYAHAGSHLIWGLPPTAPELQIARGIA
jgi:hypothetical protein